MIREGLGKSAAVNKDFNAGDGAAAEVLTEVDGAVEKLIVEKLQEAFPDHKFIGEEGIGAETEGVGRTSLHNLYNAFCTNHAHLMTLFGVQ